MTAQQTTTNIAQAAGAKPAIKTNRQENGMIMSDSVVWGANFHDISVDGVLLTPKRSLEVANHSPTGFSWGYDGSGPAQTALALLLAAGASEQKAARTYQDYNSEVISRLSDPNDFVLLGKDIINWLETTSQHQDHRR